MVKKTVSDLRLQIGVCVLALAAHTGSARADIIFFLLDDGQQGQWEQALDANNLEVSGEFDWCALPDAGIIGFNAPVTSEGVPGAGIPAGFIPEFVVIQPNVNPWGEGGPEPGVYKQNHVGASNGFGNVCNSLVAGLGGESEEILFDVPQRAMELAVVSFLGSDVVDVTVYDPNEKPLARLTGLDAAPGTAKRLGILATEGDQIGRINIFDALAGPSGGYEGMTGLCRSFERATHRSAALTGFEVVTGLHQSGDLDDMRVSDDAYVQVRSGLGPRLSSPHLMEMVVRARTDVPFRSEMNISIESRITEPGGVAKIALHNWRTGEFDQIGQYPIGLDEEEITFEGIAAADYIRVSGEIELSVKHIVVVPYLAFRFNTLIDRVLIDVRVD